MLGPKLFIVYVNDLCNVSNLVKCILFADDTSLFCSDANVNRQFERVSSVLARTCRWFATNKLSLNVLKTSYMLFRNITLWAKPRDYFSICNMIVSQSWAYIYKTDQSACQFQHLAARYDSDKNKLSLPH